MREVNRNGKVPKYVRRIELVQKRSIMYYQQQPSHPFLKIVVALPTMVTSCRGKNFRFVNIHHTHTWEFPNNHLRSYSFMFCSCNIILLDILSIWVLCRAIFSSGRYQNNFLKYVLHLIFISWGLLLLAIYSCLCYFSYLYSKNWQVFLIEAYKLMVLVWRASWHMKAMFFLLFVLWLTATSLVEIGLKYLLENIRRQQGICRTAN